MGAWQLDLSRRCAYRVRCSNTCKKISRRLGWGQEVPTTVCEMCLAAGGPLDPASLPVRAAYAQRVIDVVWKLGPNRPVEAIWAAMFNHLSPEQQAIWTGRAGTMDPNVKETPPHKMGLRLPIGESGQAEQPHRDPS